MTKFIDLEALGKKTVCRCPKCRCKHTIKMKYIGRGVPWKFCQPCKNTVEDYEAMEPQFNKYAAINRVQYART